MKISIITAVYNRKDTIAETLLSVQQQCFPDVEHIIQDGGSTDGTLEIVKRFANPDTHVASCPDEGIYDAINRGISRANGDVIGVLHSDDFFASASVLSKVAAKIVTSGTDGVYGDLDYVSALDPSRVIRHWKSGRYSLERLRYGWMPPHPTLFLRRSVFEKYGGYDTSFSVSADYDAILRWLWEHRIELSYVPEVLVKMRLGGESNRSLERVLKKSSEDYFALRKNGVGGAFSLAAKNLRKISQFIWKS